MSNTPHDTNPSATTDTPQVNPQVEQQLNALRQRIDTIDRELVRLLNERAQVVVDVGKVKRDGDAPIYVPHRERAVLEQVRQHNQGPLPDACLEAIWRELMSGSFALEKPLRVGYLGPAGSFTHLAARRKFGASVEYDGLDTIAGIFEEISRGHVDLGLVPIENSGIGGIGETLDAFLDAPVRVYGEVQIGVHHNVLSRGRPDTIRNIYSKPEVFAQCRRWLTVQLTQAERIPVASSSKAAAMAAEDPTAAAIGSSLAAELYSLPILFANVEDNPNNITRFFIISTHSAKPTGDDKTAIMFTTSHKPGALTSVLDVFRDYEINLTHIDKRPSRRVNWEYYFFIDAVGHEQDAKMQAAIEAARTHCLQLTVLGSFPKAREVL